MLGRESVKFVQMVIIVGSIISLQYSLFKYSFGETCNSLVLRACTT